jgi:FkbM family methyltransferase
MQPVKYYSQQGEDILLDRFFGSKSTGFFVDIGAFDGIHLSNSYAFELRGWSGICVEAAPDYYRLCVKNRPRSRCVHAACVAQGQGMIEFQLERGGLFSSLKTDPKFVAETFARMKVSFGGFQTIRVPAAPLNAVLEGETRPIDFLSIDVEGTELDVLAGVDLDRFNPRLLLLEANTPAERQGVDDYLGPRGYSLGRSMNWNHFYVRTAEDRHALQGITISGRLERPPHPLDRTHDKFGYALDPNVFWPPADVKA